MSGARRPARATAHAQLASADDLRATAGHFGPLVGDLPAPLPEGRASLYICAECGDMGCGGVTAVIERAADTVVWRDFGYQNDQ